MTRRVPPPLRAMLPVLDGAVSAEQLAETVVMIVESWLRQCARDGYPQPGRQARAVLARIALGSPGAAATCPVLLYAVGPRVAYAVKQQASALAASEIAAAASQDARWMTTAQAGRALGISADGVRWCLRQGLISGRRTERGWQADTRSVTAYAQGRRYGRQEAGAGERDAGRGS